jgi:hypothetical protein
LPLPKLLDFGSELVGDIFGIWRLPAGVACSEVISNVPCEVDVRSVAVPVTQWVARVSPFPPKLLGVLAGLIPVVLGRRAGIALVFDGNFFWRRRCRRLYGAL